MSCSSRFSVVNHPSSLIGRLGCPPSPIGRLSCLPSLIGRLGRPPPTITCSVLGTEFFCMECFASPLLAVRDALIPPWFPSSAVRHHTDRVVVAGGGSFTISNYYFISIDEVF